MCVLYTGYSHLAIISTKSPERGTFLWIPLIIYHKFIYTQHGISSVKNVVLRETKK